jgi:hypothetical protein
LLVTAGGLVSLWRDGREASTKPDVFTHYANAVPTVGLVSRLGFRFLLGKRSRPGDFVQIKTRREIDQTLDAAGALGGLPFMTEMDGFCGKILRVHRRVDKINDMRNKTGLRRMHDAVTLSDVRCAGSHHGGCQAECQILWKDAWLRRVPSAQADASWLSHERSPGHSPQRNVPGDDSQTYHCQMTSLWEASRSMSSFDFRQDLRPLFSGNIAVRGYLIAILTRIFNLAQRLRDGARYPFMLPTESKGVSPYADLRLKADESVVVRSKEEIARTLVNSRNRGLWFDREMIRFCGQPATVRRRVDRIIHEATGKMVVMKTPCVVLEEVTATGEFLRMCPQHEYIFWREAWLSRSQPDQPSAAASSR